MALQENNLPPTLSGAVSIDMNKLESIFKVITGKLDDQGEKIKALEVILDTKKTVYAHLNVL